MSVTVAWEGITLADGVEATEAASGLFIPLAAPMPVGTIVRVVVDGRMDEAALARVARVQESGEIGVILVGESGGPLRLGRPPAVEPAVVESPGVELNGKSEHAVAAPVSVEAEADAEEEGEQRDAGLDSGTSSDSIKNGDPDKADDKKGRRRRRKSKA